MIKKKRGSLALISWLHRLSPVIYALVFMLSAYQITTTSFSDVISKNLPDTRWISMQWIKDNIPAGSVIAREHYTPPVEQFKSDLKVIQLGISGLVNNGSKIGDNVDYVILSSGDYGRYFDGSIRYANYAKRYSDFFNKHTLIYELKPEKNISSGPTIRVYSYIPHGWSFPVK